jgi:type II secretory pathway component PulL
MGVLFSDVRDKKQYYQDQADKLRRQADEVANKTENLPEARRLDDLASEAEKKAREMDRQLREAGT